MKRAAAAALSLLCALVACGGSSPRTPTTLSAPAVPLAPAPLPPPIAQSTCRIASFLSDSSIPATSRISRLPVRPSRTCGNTISQSVQALRIVYGEGASCGTAPEPPGAFADNTIAGNVLRDPLGTGISGIVVVLPTIAQMVANNLIRGNNLGAGGVSLTPLPGFVDGGGNVCGTTGNFPC